MSTFIPIVIFILILGIVVFIHELGHFVMARRAGVFVEEFALGMGPKLIGFKGKPRKLKEEPGQERMVWHSSPHDTLPEEDVTQFSLRLFPIGGFCKMRGTDESLPDDTGALSNKKVYQRALVMAGGSLFNFIAAFLLFFVLVLLTGYSVAQVHTISENSPAHHAGLQPGDRITHIDGRRVALFEDFTMQLNFSGGQPIDVRFVRDGAAHNVTVTPMQVGDTFRLGFVATRYFGLLSQRVEGMPRVGFWGTLTTSAEMIIFNMRMPFTMLARFVSGRALPEGAGVMGPIGLAGEVTQVYQQVIEYGILDTLLTMLFITALLNAALGVMNLLPIPAMDGARLVFLGIEAVRRKPVSPEREGMVHMVGFVALILLAVFIAYRDIVRLL
ncbi:MAG: M50 family metallopeptidase [Defluviitaleaceae bacterium]|nr:M50 family metallopeptidase [Defluviitaleaceae bacterium]